MGVVPTLADAVNASDGAIRLALVYGSVARGSDDAGSDVDLLLVSDSMSLEDVFAFLAPVEDQLCRKISPTLYTSDELARRLREGNPFLKRVLTGKYIWLKGDMDAIGLTAG
jgi:predicted nucleotidyltransferase